MGIRKLDLMLSGWTELSDTFNYDNSLKMNYLFKLKLKLTLKLVSGWTELSGTFNYDNSLKMNYLFKLKLSRQLYGINLYFHL